MTALAPQIRVLIKNSSGMDIPPRSVVVATGVVTNPSTSTRDAISYTTVDQYGCGKNGNVMVTGPETIKAGAKGSGYFDQFIYASIDPLSRDPVPGEEWGPIEGSWVIVRGGKGFFAQGHSDNGGRPKRSMFLRTFVRAPASRCLSSSSSASSSASSGSVSGSSSSSANCGCITVVTSVSCGAGGLTVTYGQARGCC